MLNHDQSDHRYGSGAGSQCQAISFIAMGANEKIKEASLWNENDIITIMHASSGFYRNNIRTGNIHLTTDDLPREISFFTKTVKLTDLFSVEFGFVLFPRLIMIYLTRCILFFQQRCTGAMFTASLFTVSILRCENHFFVLDSHSQNSLGFQCPNGGANFLQITSVDSISMFVMKQCQAGRGIDKNMYYALSWCNFISLEVTNDLL